MVEDGGRDESCGNRTGFALYFFPVADAVEFYLGAVVEAGFELGFEVAVLLCIEDFLAGELLLDKGLGCRGSCETEIITSWLALHTIVCIIMHISATVNSFICFIIFLFLKGLLLVSLF